MTGERQGEGFGQSYDEGGICGLAPPAARFQAPAVTPAGAQLLANAGAGAGATPPDNIYVELMQPQAAVSWPRCVTLRTVDGYPFDVRIEWTNGQGAWVGPLTVTAPAGACKVYLDATAMRVSAAAWENNASRIQGGVSNREGDNSDPRRVLAVRNIPTGQPPANELQLLNQVPRFAEKMSCICSDPAQLANIQIEFRTPAGVVVAAFPANLQQIPVPPVFAGGAAGGIFAVNNNPNIVVALYVSFHLSW